MPRCSKCPFGKHILHVSSCLFLDGGSRVLFTAFISTFFNKIFIKTESHDTIYIFKNYFAIVFSIFSNKQYLNILLQ